VRAGTEQAALEGRTAPEQHTAKMIVTEKFAFIHLHKTGGQTLNDVIRRAIPGHEVVGYHFPRRELPEQYAHLPVVAVVRNPWDWYVSWYSFNRRPGIRNPLFNVVSDSGEDDFKSTVTNLVRLGSDAAVSKLYRNDLIQLLPETLDDNQGVGLIRDDIRGFAGSKAGYYSWLVERMLGDLHDRRLHIARFENLADDFLAIMRELDVPELEALQTELDKRERKNASSHSHYSHYYDDELRELVTTLEQPVIERFDYRFEQLKPGGACYEHEADSSPGPTTFRKLLGREANYLKLGDAIDVTALSKRIEEIPEARWDESGREKLFAVHRDTRSLQLVHFEDFKHETPEFFPLYDELEDEVRPLVDYISRYYKNNGFVVRMLLAKLLAGGKIPHHTDAGYSLLSCHRVHVPLITNDDVTFTVGGERKTMRAGEFWEINNGVDHAVENQGDQDRIHIIIDWMPNPDGKSQQDVLSGGEVAPEQRDSARDAAIHSRLTQGHQLLRAGKLEQAESQFRQILHADPKNVIANNLLGLLCLQTRRLEEAASFISAALEVKPDDAQAHSNLALALKDLQRHEEAIGHFREAVKLAPQNARVLNNLGGTYVELNRFEDAVECFRHAVALEPGLAEAHFNLGNALIGVRQYGEAVDSLARSVALKPGFAEAQAKLEKARRALESQTAGGPN